MSTNDLGEAEEHPEQVKWSKDPDKWPYTPPLEEYLGLAAKDPLLVWRMETGHLVNLLDAALDRIEELEGPDE